MTDEEWEKLMPLVEDYENAMNAQNAFAMETLGLSKNYAHQRITRELLDVTVRKLRLDQRVKWARSELQVRCSYLFGVDISV